MMKAALSVMHGLFACGVFCAAFCVRIFVRGFLVRMFGAAFLVRIFFRMFHADFSCGCLGGFFLAIFFPKSSPNPNQDSGYSPVAPHLDSKEVWVHTLMLLWRLAPKVVVFLATGGSD